MIGTLIAAATVVAAPDLVRVSNSFEFYLDAPMARAAPYFGPEGERAWAGAAWNPQFVHPAQPKDVEGAVFTISHGETTQLWVNTLFDLARGRMQYVTFVAGVMTSTIDVSLQPRGAGTSVKVTYTRTALASSANALVQAAGRSDATSAEKWRSAITNALGASNGSKPEDR